MSLTQAEVTAFCERIVALEEDKKEIAEEIKVSIETFAETNEMTKKSVAKFIKAYKEVQKDKDEYTLTDLESDQLICIAFPEFLTGNENPAEGE